VLDRIADATHVPEQALTVRSGEDGVFVVSADGKSVSWHKVEVGIREDGRVQVSGDGVAGRVVVLGQQLLDNGSAVTVPANGSAVSVRGVGPHPDLLPQAGKGTQVR
jgi:multidrug efflux pump subunit AcrA (membrane-fusion protein)